MAFQLRGRSSGIQLPGSRRARLTINPLSNPMGVRGQRREGGFQVANKGPKTGFAKIKKAEVSKIKRRGGKTAGGKKIRDPEAYVAGGLRRTGIKKLGEREFKRRTTVGRRRG